VQTIESSTPEVQKCCHTLTPQDQKLGVRERYLQRLEIAEFVVSPLAFLSLPSLLSHYPYFVSG